ncbi:MAG: ribosome small subunit-dependent GTPase A [Clostridia bacterium]|nr:ribosome small subunit-dependent GTPase A [Clostridia bacterium]
MIKIGQVYKASSNKYVVRCNDEAFKCTARGVLKIKGDGICVGDIVKISENSIEEVLPRKNRFVRPSVSNIDLIVIVIAPEPKPDLILIDKLVLNAIKEDTPVIFAVNKSDISSKLIDQLKSEYSSLDLTFIQTNTLTGEGVEELKELLKGKLSVLAGQSAVGKTSLVNALFGLSLETGELSEKILRGKHTTTRSEIFENNQIKLIDTPGFAVIDAQVELDELHACYTDYLSVSNECRFRGCSHINEPDCAVKSRVKDGIFSKDRY